RQVRHQQPAEPGAGLLPAPVEKNPATGRSQQQLDPLSCVIVAAFGPPRLRAAPDAAGAQPPP
ncbi:MAG: hypothetical protein ACR2MC_00845, partial [Actinomycetota bacterium]